MRYYQNLATGKLFFELEVEALIDDFCDEMEENCLTCPLNEDYKCTTRYSNLHPQEVAELAGYIVVESIVDE